MEATPRRAASKKKKVSRSKGSVYKRGHCSLLLLLVLVEGVGQAALAAVLAVKVVGHEDASAALTVGALAAKAGDLAVVVDLVVLEDGEFDLLLLVVDLLGLGVDLLLALLATTIKVEDNVEGGLLANEALGKDAVILELLAAEDDTHVLRKILLVLDLLLYDLNGLIGPDLEGDGSRQSLDEDLHYGS